MSYEKIFKKMLSLTVSSAILLTGMSFPTMAAVPLGSAYSKAGIVNGNGLALEDFKGLYENADYAAVETFEDVASEAFEPTTIQAKTVTTAKIKFFPIIGEGDTPLTGEGNYWQLTLTRPNVNEVGLVDDTLATTHTFSSGKHALQINNIPQGLTFSLGEIANNRALKPVAFGWSLTGASTKESSFSIDVTYSDNSSETISIALKGKADDETQFVGFKAPEEAYITDINIPAETMNTVRNAYVDDIAVIFKEQPAVAEKIVIEGDDVVYTPVYGVPVPNKYSYVASVLDQFGRKMEEEEVTLSISGENDAIGFETSGSSGVLSISEMVDVPTGLKIIAQSVNHPHITSTMAVRFGNVPYSKAGIVNGNGLTLDKFKELYDRADFADVETFENPETGNYTPNQIGKKISTASIHFYPIIGEDGNPVTGKKNRCMLELKRTANDIQCIDDTVVDWHEFSSGKKALSIGNIAKGLTFGIGEIENNRALKPVAFGWSLTGASSSASSFSINVTYSDNSSETISVSLKGREEEETLFVGFKAPEGAYIANINIPGDSTLARSAVVDDIAIIFKEQPAVATSIEIEGDKIVYTPVYGVKSPNKRPYIAYVLDQFGRKMEEEGVTLSISGANDAIGFKTSGGSGVLSVSAMDSVPTDLKIIAQSENHPDISLDDISVEVRNVPYYNEDFIGDIEGIMVGETTAKRDENDDVGDSTISRAKFVSLLDTAREAQDKDKDMTIINFVSDDLTVSQGVASMPLYQSGQMFSLGTAARKMSLVEIDENGNEGTNGPMAPTAGNRYYNLLPEGSGGNELIMNTDMLGDLEVTAMGFVVLSRDGKMKIGNGFRVIATYSNGKKGYFSQDINSAVGVEGRRENNVFFGIKAPPGHYITNVKIVTSTATKSAYGRLDEFGFVFEVPDIKGIEEDFSQLKFSDISDESMQHITKDLNLSPYSTIGSSTVTWTTNPEGVIAQDGTLTPPDAPTAEGYTPMVNLIATFESGVLKKEKIFELFVPSKLEMDRDAITVPSEVSDDITLPTSGSIYGSTITWSAKADSPIVTSGADLGKVTRPQDKDKYVLLTATISNPSGSVTKDFGVMVKATNPAPSGGGTGSGGGGGGGGGPSGIAAPTVIPPQKTPVEVKPTEDEGKTAFNDLAATHWAHDSIMELYEKGIVNGTGENSFEPEGNVTREQYLAMLIRALGLTSEEKGADFTDVSEDAWYYDIIMTARKLGITDGYADGSFGVGRSITREEMAVMAYRSAEKAGVLIEGDTEDALWGDAGEISEFATDAVSALNKAGIIKGISENEFSPKTTATRAQSAVIISRILEVSAIEK